MSHAPPHFRLLSAQGQRFPLHYCPYMHAEDDGGNVIIHMDSGERGVGVRFGVQIIWATAGEPWTYLHGAWFTKATVWEAKSGVRTVLALVLATKPPDPTEADTFSELGCRDWLDRTPYTAHDSHVAGCSCRVHGICQKALLSTPPHCEPQCQKFEATKVRGSDPIQPFQHHFVPKNLTALKPKKVSGSDPTFRAPKNSHARGLILSEIGRSHHSSLFLTLLPHRRHFHHHQEDQRLDFPGKTPCLEISPLLNCVSSTGIEPGLSTGG